MAAVQTANVGIPTRPNARPAGPLTGPARDPTIGPNRSRKMAYETPTDRHGRHGNGRHGRHGDARLGLPGRVLESTWSQTRVNPTEDPEMRRLAQRTAERASQRKAKSSASDPGREAIDLKPALRTVGILELRYIRLLSSLCALSYGGHTKPGAVARRHGLSLVTHSAACTACTPAEVGVDIGSPLAHLEYSDAMASVPAASDDSSASEKAGVIGNLPSLLANNIAAFQLPWRRKDTEFLDSQLALDVGHYSLDGIAPLAFSAMMAHSSGSTAPEPIINPTPTHWFVADDERDGTRYFVIQGSDSWDHWRVNLSIDPIEFEPGRGLNTCIHRGVYEVAQMLYPLFLPLVKEHLECSNGEERKRDNTSLRRVAFTGHSLGGAVGQVLALMLAARGELKARQLAPVYAFGAPAIFAQSGMNPNWENGRRLLHTLGLDAGCLRQVTLHRDLVPRLLACDWGVVADVLRRVSTALSTHPSLQRGEARQAVYRPVGRLYILQPPETLRFAGPRSYHPMLPAKAGLFRVVDPVVSCRSRGDEQPQGDRDETSTRAEQQSSVPAHEVATADEAIWELLNSPHPLETLADPRSYGRGGAISRYHNPDNYTLACGSVLRCRGRKLGSVLQKVTERHGSRHVVPLVRSCSQEEMALARETIDSLTPVEQATDKGFEAVPVLETHCPGSGASRANKSAVPLMAL